MINIFYNLPPLIQALLAGLFTFSFTILGAASVFLFKSNNKKVMDGMLSISAGIMFAAAIFSLLIPAIEQATQLKFNTLLVIPLSIILGTLLLLFGDYITNKALKLENNNSNIILLVVSIILHNIPEGLAIGLAFGSTIYNIEGATIMAALSLTFGIAIQNFPEGAAISLPLKRSGYSTKNSFLLGLLSGMVEPISAVIGVILALKIKYILPFMLAFAAGAMILVVVKELIPESQNNDNKNLMAFLAIIGFIFMVILELM